MWWEVDVNGYIISFWEKIGLVWNVQRAPKYVRDADGTWVQEKKPVTSGLAESLEVESPESMSLDDGGILFADGAKTKAPKTNTKVA